MASGTFKTNLSDGLDLVCIWSSIADEYNNFSTVFIEEWVYSKYSIPAVVRDFSIYCDGNGQVFWSEIGFDTDGYSVEKTKVGSSSFIVNHEKDGDKKIEITCRWSANLMYHGEYIDLAETSKTVQLDKIDRTANDISVSLVEITENSAVFEIQTTKDSDSWYFSIDHGKTWNKASSGFQSSSVFRFRILKLKPNTKYYFLFKARNQSNGVYSISPPYPAKTHPIYIESILAPESVFIAVGEKKEFQISVLPNNASIKELDIVVENSSVATFSDGCIYGKSPGSTVISLWSKDGSSVRAFSTIYCGERVTGIIFEPKKITVKKGDTINLTARVVPENAYNKKISYVSSNTSVLNVSGNTLTAIENGTASIIAKTEDGNFESTMVVDVVGETEYSWYDYTLPLEVLNSEDVFKIKKNIETIRSMLLVKGISVDELLEVSHQKDTQFYKIFETLQNIELNLDIINDNVFKSIYWESPVIVGEYASNKEDIWRWIRILNDMHDILTGKLGRWGILLCEDGYPAINGKRIVVRQPIEQEV